MTKLEIDLVAAKQEMGDAFNQVHELMEEKNLTAHTSESEPSTHRSEKF